MKLYGGALSPFVQRVLLVAKVKGVALPLEPAPGGIKSPEYRALNPMGKMPTLLDGDMALPESAVIAEYLDEVLSGPSVLGATPQDRAHVRLISRLADLYLYANLGPLFGARQNPDALPPAMAKLAEGMDYLDALLPRRAVPGFTLIDASLIPLFFFFEALDGSAGTARLIADRPHLAAWWAAAKASEIGAATLAEMGAALKAFMAPSK
ncbi:glutathione S-transferase family protein [Sandaracinobacteroides saxicola]|uniref:Glutathione S-transferase family protein n=1 Tax=Sandaracinobacteroides saxicola TaxID=2759707 RepID=A0A7G5IFS5_9SPHN|nr:glutathione S-transferase family protein [Sandaracinobacteroides saxicola]QMW22217.1 glutathione S-transferase family protein [Sandaracinobacteroides saxicola]